MDNFTIIITSFNRPKCLFRTLTFLLSFKMDFKIIIADSSFSNQDFSKIKSIKFGDKIRFQKFDPNIKVAEKISKSLNYVETEFCVLCADDDFIFPESIRQCIEFLKKNMDYASCHGKYYIHTAFNFTKKFGIIFREQSKKTLSCEQENPLARIQSYLDGQIGSQYTFYAVFRTKHLKTIWQQTFLYANNWLINEYFPCIISLILGKMKTLPIFYMSREPNFNNWIDKNRVKLILSEKNNQIYADGIIQNLIREKVKGINENLKNKYFLIFQQKKENMINNEVNFKPITKENIFKAYLRFLRYFYFNRKLISNNIIKLEYFKQIEKIIVENGNVSEEIVESRNNY